MIRIKNKVYYFVVLALSLGIGCASNVPRVQMAADADPAVEVTKLEGALNEARVQQLDVISPKNFKHAEKSYETAKKFQSKEKSQKDVLDSVGEGQAALNLANEKAGPTRTALFDVIEARKQAQVAGANKYYDKDLREVDEDLIDVSEEYENGNGKLSQSARTSLKNDYLDLELKAIQTTHLSQAKNLIESAMKNDAGKLVPKSLVMAQAKLKNAESVIATNRHNQTEIENVSNDATNEAKTLIRVTSEARAAKGLSTEDLAVEMDRKNNLVAAGTQQLAVKDATIDSQNVKISAKTDELGAMSSENAELQQKDKFNQSLIEAEKSFSKDQADVYRQGDKLVIRLKSMNFASGRSEISGSTFEVLSKVKDVMLTLHPEQVVVEGHTDSVGSKNLNQMLSEKRASSVAAYLVSTKVVSDEQVGSQGFGFSKPISTNKTKIGREQNRRVDIIITPTMVK